MSEQMPIGGEAILRRCRKWMLRCKSVPWHKGLHARLRDKVCHKRGMQTGKAKQEGAAVKVQDNALYG